MADKVHKQENGSLEKLKVVITPFHHNSHSGGKKGVNVTLHFLPCYVSHK